MSTILKALRRLEEDGPEDAASAKDPKAPATKDAEARAGALATGAPATDTDASRVASSAPPLPATDPRATDQLRTRILAEEAAAEAGLTAERSEPATSFLADLRPRFPAIATGLILVSTVSVIGYSLYSGPANQAPRPSFDSAAARSAAEPGSVSDPVDVAGTREPMERAPRPAPAAGSTLAPVPDPLGRSGAPAAPTADAASAARIADAAPPTPPTTAIPAAPADRVASGSSASPPLAAEPKRGRSIASLPTYQGEALSAETPLAQAAGSSPRPVEPGNNALERAAVTPTASARASNPTVAKAQASNAAGSSERAVAEGTSGALDQERVAVHSPPSAKSPPLFSGADSGYVEPARDASVVPTRPRPTSAENDSPADVAASVSKPMQARPSSKAKPKSRPSSAPKAAPRAPARSAASQPTASRDVERIDRRGLPDISVVRTSWHPNTDRRSTRVKLEGSDENLTLREGDAVGGFIVQEITPSSVLFSAGDVEVRRRVGEGS